MSAEYYLVCQDNKEILCLGKINNIKHRILGGLIGDITKTDEEIYEQHMEYDMPSEMDIDSELGYTVHLSAYQTLLCTHKRFASFVFRNMGYITQYYSDNTFLDWWHLEYGETPPPCGFSQNYKGDYKVFEL